MKLFGIFCHYLFLLSIGVLTTGLLFFLFGFHCAEVLGPISLFVCAFLAALLIYRYRAMLRSKSVISKVLTVTYLAVTLLIIMSLMSMAAARNKGADASVKMTINELRAHAAVYANDAEVPSYDGLCNTNAISEAEQIIAQVQKNRHVAGCYGVLLQEIIKFAYVQNSDIFQCSDGTDHYVVQAVLPFSYQGDKTYYCIDTTETPVRSKTVLTSESTQCIAE